MAYYLDDFGGQPCCDSCDSGLPCESAGLGFVMDPDTIDPNVQTQADGSLDSYGTVEGLVGGVPIAGQFAQAGMAVFQFIEHLFKFGAGRHEADLITPTQNKVWAYIVEVSQQGLSTTNVLQLQSLVIELENLASNWLKFLSDPRFTDGRASAQAANSIMPYLDGTCGYRVHNLQPTQGADTPTDQDSPCMPDGHPNAWPHNWGYGAGILGALKKRLVDNGGQLPMPAITQGYGSTIPTLQYPGMLTQGMIPTQAGWLSPYVTTNPAPIGDPSSLLSSPNLPILAVGIALFLLL